MPRGTRCSPSSCWRTWIPRRTPTLKPVPGIDLPDYKRTLIERFANPGVRDTIARLCFGSSDRIPKWLLPVIRENLRTGAPVRLSAATVASWARYAEGVDEQGEPIDVQDQLADTLVPLAKSQREKPTAFIENTEVFGDLATIPGSSTPICGRWIHCTATARARRFRHCVGEGAGHDRAPWSSARR